MPSSRPDDGFAPPQTVLHGVAASSLLNVVSRLFAWARQAVITASFGLVSGLDAFYVAAAFASIFVNTFGDLADAVGLPALVRTRQRNGTAAFRSLAAVLVRRSLLLGAALTSLMLVASSWAPAIVPGFPRAAKGDIVRHLLLLAPYALVFVSYHVLGSLFRSARVFHVFYTTELVVNAIALVTVWALRDTLDAVPVSFSLAYVCGAALLAVRWRRWLGPERGIPPAEEVAAVSAGAARMVPVYAVGYVVLLVDRFFASYLPEGSISALFYGYILAFLVPGVMNVENAFATALAEEGDRSVLLTRVFSGAWLVAVPVTVFTAIAAEDVVSLLFQRGSFGPQAVAVTGAALRCYVLALPVVFVWPTCIRALQIGSRYGSVLTLALAGATCNAALDYLLVFRIPLGVRGIALATSATWAALLAPMLIALARSGTQVRWREFAGTLPGSLAGAAAGLVLVLASAVSGWPVVVRGAIFCAAYGAVAGFLVRTAEVERLREMVAFSFPPLKRLLFLGRTSPR